MRIKTALLVLVIIVLSIKIWGRRFDNNLQAVHYKLTSSKISKESFKIVMFGDLHNRIWGSKQQLLITLIRQAEPDLVLLVGDLFDEKTNPAVCELVLEGLQNLPVYYVTGNHEYLTENVPQVLSILKNKGVTILDDEYKIFTNHKGSLVLGGINDPQGIKFGHPIKSHTALLEIFRKVSQSRYFSILLAHKPEQMERYCHYGFDLVVSAHTHGGQVRIPHLINGLYSADQGFFPSRSGGLYEDYGMPQIINRGVSNPYSVPRLWNPPEISIIEIAPH